MATASNPHGASVSLADGTLKYLRVKSDAQGAVQFEDAVDKKAVRPNGQTGPFLPADAHAYAIFSAPSRHVTPPRTIITASHPEMMLITAGDATIKGGTQSRQVAAGSYVIFENDKGAGHSIEAGANGYTAFKIVLSARRPA